MRQCQKLAHYVMLEVFGEDPGFLDGFVPVPWRELRDHAVPHESLVATVRAAPPRSGVSVEVSEGPPRVVRYFFRKPRQTNAFLRRVREELRAGDLARLHAEREQRLDAAGRFSFRLEKAAFAAGRLVLVDGGACVQVVVSVAAYPKARCRELVDNLLTGPSGRREDGSGED